ncbi:MAG: dihydrofolate reductase family protein [Actinotalea sp.]|nr:dihydrofolate reductase family protein [Actinotalea sp.]
MPAAARLPRVVLHAQTSVDGRMAVSAATPLLADNRWPQGDPYPELMARLAPQVFLEGAGSFVTDEAAPAPLPPVDAADDLHEHWVPDDVRARATRGWLAVTDSRGRVRWQYKEFPDDAWAGWHLLVLVATATPSAYLAYLRRERIPYLVVGQQRVVLPQAVRALGEVLGAQTVVVTAGARLSGALLRAGVLDELEVEVLPMSVGGTTTPTLFTTPDLGPADAPVPLRLLGAEPRDGGRVPRQES